jgi:hypothetical protein
MKKPPCPDREARRMIIIIFTQKEEKKDKIFY